MLETATVPAIRCYPVEVSGWDSAQNFFVEKCDLVWREDNGKQIRLLQDLRDNTIVFVRLLQPGQAEHAHPVAYEVQLVEESLGGGHQFQLKMVVPRLREVPAWSGTCG